MCWSVPLLLASWDLRELKVPGVCGPEIRWPVLYIREVGALRDAYAKRNHSFLHRSSRQRQVSHSTTGL